MRYVVFYENFQLADKIYYRTSKLSKEQQELIRSVTGNDNYTKFIADVVYRYPFYTQRNLEEIYDLIRNYNKNTFPIEGLGDINKLDFVSAEELSSLHQIDVVIVALKSRDRLIKVFKELPSIARRNLKEDTRTPMLGYGMNKYRDRLEYLRNTLNYLSNRPDHLKEKIYRKIFKKGQTLEDMLEVVEDKQNLIKGEYLTPKKIRERCSDHYDLELIYEESKVMVVRVDGLDGIIDIGRNSLWCFTYGRSHKDWTAYSTNGIVYVIFDFNLRRDDTDHMMVLIRPFHENDPDNGHFSLYDMVNDGKENPWGSLSGIIPPEKIDEIFSFE